jgi:hypothetical protein
MTTRLRQHLLTMLLTLGLIAGGGAALAAVGSVTADETPAACPTETQTPDVTNDEGGLTGDEQTGDEQGEGEQSCGDPAVDDDQDGDDQGEDVLGDETGDDETGDDGTGEEPTPPAEDGTTPEREAECAAAAGIDPTAPPADETDDETTATGLDNAIAHVLANCLKNPDATGLPNALEHLVANAERKAAHDAAKAAGEHGNSANAPGHSGETHGNSGGEHGNSANAPGHTGEHGNPHA